MLSPSVGDELAGRHLVFVLAGGVLGGAERGALDLAAHARRQAGASVSVVALDHSDGHARSMAEAAGIPWHAVPRYWSTSPLANTAALATFAASVRRLRPDVVLASTNRPNVFCGLTWRAAGAKLAVWNQCDVLATRRFSPRTFRRALERTPLVLTKALHGKEWLAETWRLGRERIHVVPGQAALPAPREARDAWRARLGLGEGDLAACMLAHLIPGKGHVEALEAWRHVVGPLEARGRRAVLVLAGRPAATADAVADAVVRLGLTSSVRLLGEVEDVSGLLDAVDLAVFASASELLPRGVTEPMSRGLAVVATDTPGTREALGPGGERFLVPRDDAARLAAAVLDLACDPRLRAEVGAANADLVRARQGPSASDAYLALVADGLGRATRRSAATLAALA